VVTDVVEKVRAIGSSKRLVKGVDHD